MPSKMSKTKKNSVTANKNYGNNPINSTPLEDAKNGKGKKQVIKCGAVYLRVEKLSKDKSVCKCSKSIKKGSQVLPNSKNVETEPSLRFHERVVSDCLGQCDFQKRKRLNKKNALLEVAESPTRQFSLGRQENDNIKAREPISTTRRPILILKKKCVRKGEVTGTSPSMPLFTTSVASYSSIGKWKIFLFGEKGSGSKAKGELQDFYKLRDDYLDSGTLFEDPEFPATDSSLFFSHRPDRYYEWKRPHEICDNPQFFVEGYSRFDVQQGELGDCWLLAAAANLTLYHRLFLQVVPDDQDFDDKYTGIFHFRFWQYGRWIDVVIDDRLPTYRGQLVFLHSSEDNEFWSALLEKAYAKLHGSYEALKGGSTCEAMEDFTGGVTEMYEMDASPPNLFQIMLKAYERASLMGCSIEPDPNIVEAETPEGLIRGHAYSITRVQHVDIQTPNVVGKIPLLRLRNPWGNESEWNGPWSDGAPEWRFISETEKEELGLTFDHDGEFWMSFKDFQKHFSRTEICNLNPDSLSEEELREGNKKKWAMSLYEGEWVRGVTAGGCRNFLDTFWHNPQYRVTLTEVDDDDDDGNCTFIVALMQKNRRLIRNTGAEFLTIGFAIYYIPYPDKVPKPLDLQFFKYNASVARSPTFINLREISCRFKLPPGTYCIVPSTFDPNEEGEFLLRVFSEKQNNMEENDQQIGYDQLDKKISCEIPIVRVKVPAPIPVYEPPVQKIVKDWIQGAEAEVTSQEEQQDKICELFFKLTGEDEEIGWEELKEILNYGMGDEFVKNGFSNDVCRSMIAMMDFDRSGKLGYEEFKHLWDSLQNWKNVWTLYDTDKSGTFSGFELRDAMHSVGYLLNNKVLNALMHLYGTKYGEIQFEDFIMCATKIKTVIDKFRAKDITGTNTATFSMEEWLDSTLRM